MNFNYHNRLKAFPVSVAEKCRNEDEQLDLLDDVLPTASTFVILDMMSLNPAARNQGYLIDYSSAKLAFWRNGDVAAPEIHAIYMAEEDDESREEAMYQCSLIPHAYRPLSTQGISVGHRAVMGFIYGHTAFMQVDELILATDDFDTALTLAETVGRVTFETRLTFMSVSEPKYEDAVRLHELFDSVEKLPERILHQIY